MTSLLDTIRAYQAALIDFNKNSPEDDALANAYADVSYGPHLARLNQWKQPAESLEAAREALRISLTDSGGVYGSEAATRMVEAALGFLDKEPAPIYPDVKEFPGHLLRDADNSLIECMGYLYAVKMIIVALEQSPRGREVDDALHSMLLIADNAYGSISSARSQIEIADDLLPVDKSNSGEN